MWVPGRDAARKAADPPVNITPAKVTEEASEPKNFVPPGDRLIAASAYITFLPAIIFLLIVPFKHNRFVRFHSFQSIFLTLATIAATIAMRILYSVLTFIPVAGYLLAWLACAVALLGWGILWLVVIVKALQGETFRVPWIGSFVEKVSS